MTLLWKIEAILFAAGDKVDIEELEKLLKTPKEEIIGELKKLQEIYKARESALGIFDEGQFWKLTVKETYLPLVRRIITHTELSKSLMETLAVLAWKCPMRQSELVDIRSNKAYDHIAELETMGFISKEKKGRTFILNLTQKFFDYFELNGKKDIEKRFGNVEELEKKLLPQKHVDDFVEEKNPEEEAAARAAEEEKKMHELSQSISAQRNQDADFLKAIEQRIGAVKSETDGQVKEFSDMLPKPEASVEDMEQPSEESIEQQTEAVEVSEKKE